MDLSRGETVLAPLLTFGTNAAMSGFWGSAD